MKGLFITGTDTGVGKTIVSAQLLSRAQLKFDSVKYIKPIQTGLDQDCDTDTISSLVKHAEVTQILGFRHPLSPHRAAYLENTQINFSELLRTTKKAMSADMNIIEGAGGLLVPINQRYLMIDLIAALKVPVVLVSRSSLGTINHSLLSLEALHKRHIAIAGVVMCGPKNCDNQLSIAHFGRLSTVITLEDPKNLDQLWPQP